MCIKLLEREKKKTRDLNQVKYIKDEVSKILVEERTIQDR